MNRELFLKVEEWFRRSVGKFDFEDMDQVLDKSARIVEKVLSSDALSREIHKVRILMRMLSDYRKGEYTQVPWNSVAAIGVALLYILIPIDIIPDVIPVVGFTDDLAMLLFVWKMILRDVEEYVRWKCSRDMVDSSFRELVLNIFGEELCSGP